MRFSKFLLEMRKKEQALAKLRKYEEAGTVKEKADEIEAKERVRLEQEMQEQVGKREGKVRGQQLLALSALMKRVQRDRDEQLKQRQLDSQRYCAGERDRVRRLIQRNKNLLNDLLGKHSYEIKRTLECLKQTLGAVKSLEPIGKLQTSPPANKVKEAAA